MSNPDPTVSAPLELKVFLSSPGDVADERGLARRVLASLEKDPLLRARVRFDEVSWDDAGHRGVQRIPCSTERERVFERFYRGTGHSGPGSGLGLSIVADIAALHRAEVELDDRPFGGLCA